MELRYLHVHVHALIKIEAKKQDNIIHSRYNTIHNGSYLVRKKISTKISGINGLSLNNIYIVPDIEYKCVPVLVMA